MLILPLTKFNERYLVVSRAKEINRDFDVEGFADIAFSSSLSRSNFCNSSSDTGAEAPARIAFVICSIRAASRASRAS